MSQNQAYFWRTTRQNVYLKCNAKLRLLLALMLVLTFATICRAEIEPNMFKDSNEVDAIKAFGVEPQRGFQTPDASPASSETVKEAKRLPSFIDAFTASISVILFTELGDKTFFIAAIMAMRHPRFIVFIGAIAALALMTVLSVVFGVAATIIPKVYTYYISTGLFAIFGLKMIYEGYFMKPGDVQEELEEVQSDLRKREDEFFRKGKYVEDVESSSKRKNSNIDALHQSEQQVDENSAGVAHHHEALIQNSLDADADAVEIHHRQRKQNHNNNVETKPYLKNNKSSDNNILVTKPNCDIEDSDGYEGCATPELSASLASNQTNQTEATTKLNSSVEALNGEVATVDSTAQLQPNGTVVTSADATHSVAGTPNAAGQLNGELKQRLDREVNVALVPDPESGVMRKNNRRNAAYLTGRILFQAFTMTFLAEWGDRSQLTTILLAASKDYYGVIAGGILGHSICTGLAVVGGRMVAAKISVRTVTLVGGLVFLGFAVYALIVRPDDI